MFPKLLATTYNEAKEFARFEDPGWVSPSLILLNQDTQSSPVLQCMCPETHAGEVNDHPFRDPLSAN